MSTSVDICNLGLSHIGARAQINSISPPDGSVESGLCARFYPIARREMLEAAAWSFATKRVALSQVTNVSTVWLYAYAKPSDCVRALRIPPLTLIEAQQDLTLWAEDVSRIGSERASTQFEIEGDVIYTNEVDAVLIYTTDISDSNKFTPSFVTGLGMLMASYLSGPIIKGDAGAKTGAQWRSAAMNFADTAAARDARASSDTDTFIPSHLAARS